MSHSVDWYQHCVTFQKREVSFTPLLKLVVSQFPRSECGDKTRKSARFWNRTFVVQPVSSVFYSFSIVACSVGSEVPKNFIVFSSISPELIPRIPVLCKSRCGFMFIPRLFVSFMLNFEHNAVPVATTRFGSVDARKSFLIKGYFTFTWAVECNWWSVNKI